MGKIRKYLSVAAAASVLLILVVPVFAKTAQLYRPLNGRQTTQEDRPSGLESKKKEKPIRPDVTQKIKQFKDEKRQKLAEKIIRQLDHINQTVSNHFIRVLDKLEKILGKVESRAKKVSEKGQDPSQINAGIQKAKEAILAARTAVADQTKKTYEINISTLTAQPSTPDGQNDLVSGFREQFQSLKDKLKKDLFSLRDGPVKNARTAVHDVLKLLSEIPGVGKEQ